MTMRNAFEGLSTEDLQLAILMTLREIADGLARVDANDRSCVRIEAIDGGITLSTLNSLNQLGGRDAAVLVPALSIPMHIYNNIVST